MSTGKMTHLQREHMLLQEHIRAVHDRLLHAVLRAAGTTRAGKRPYALRERVVLRERFEEPFARRGRFGRGAFVVSTYRVSLRLCVKRDERNEETYVILRTSSWNCGSASSISFSSATNAS